MGWVFVFEKKKSGAGNVTAAAAFGMLLSFAVPGLGELHNANRLKSAATSVKKKSFMFNIKMENNT